MKILLVLLFILALFPSRAFALNLDPVPYRTKVYGEMQDIFCQLRNPVENIACLAHDAAMGLKNAHQLNENQTRSAIAIELANIIQRLSSSPRYSLYDHFMKKFIDVSKNPENCLLNSFGICGNHQELFSKAMGYLEIETRKVSVYYVDIIDNRQNHAAAEFLIGNKWRYIDITWNAFWLSDSDDISSILSFEEVLNSANPPTKVNSTDMWYHYKMKTASNAFSYLNANNYFLFQYGNSGVLELFLNEQPEKFLHIPNYIGANKPGENIKFKINVATGREGIYNFKVSGIWCHEERILLISGTEEFKLKKGDNFIPLKNTQMFNLKHKPGNICYAVFEKIELKQHQ